MTACLRCVYFPQSGRLAWQLFLLALNPFDGFRARNYLKPRSWPSLQCELKSLFILDDLFWRNNDTKPESSEKPYRMKHHVANDAAMADDATASYLRQRASSVASTTLVTGVTVLGRDSANANAPEVEGEMIVVICSDQQGMRGKNVGRENPIQEWQRRTLPSQRR